MHTVKHGTRLPLIGTYDPHLDFLTASVIARRVRSGELCPVAYLEHLFSRIETVDPQIGAFLVVGMKPAFGTLPTDGVFPLAPSLDHVGVITRTVTDNAFVVIDGHERVYLDWFLRRKTANPWSFSDEDLDEYIRIFSQPGALRAGLAFYRSVNLSAEQNRVLVRDAKLAMPVLAVSADHGSIPDMAGPLRPFAADLRGETITRRGHFIPEEQPEALARLFSDFFM